jgi:hypothetical protein
MFYVRKFWDWLWILSCGFLKVSYFCICENDENEEIGLNCVDFRCFILGNFEIGWEHCNVDF